MKHGSIALMLLLAGCSAQETSQTQSVGNPTALWPSNNIAFEFDAAVPANTRRVILDGINLWNDNTFIRFTENPSQTPRIRFTYSTDPNIGGSSRVGRGKESTQDVLLTTGATAGTVAHELGHALGLEHEHTRLDRDKYVVIKFDNIRPEYRYNFDISSNALDFGGYDYESIMHYPAHGFAIDTSKPTIVRKDNGVVLGQRIALSIGDRFGVASLYQRIPPSTATSTDWPATSLSGHDYCRAAGFISGALDGNTYPYSNKGRVFGVVCFDGAAVQHFPNTNVSFDGTYLQSQLKAHDFCTSQGLSTGYFDGNTAIVNGARVWGISCIKGASRVLTSFAKYGLNPGSDASQVLQRAAFQECRGRGFVSGLPEGNWVGNQDIIAFQCFGGIYQEAYSGINN